VGGSGTRRAHVLTHFTIAAGNDVPARDPTEFKIEGSMDGATWTHLPLERRRLPVLAAVGSGALRRRRRRLRRAAAVPLVPLPLPGGDEGLHQINELEFFGVPVAGRP
jgi:hypothetical protein